MGRSELKRQGKQGQDNTRISMIGSISHKDSELIYQGDDGLFFCQPGKSNKAKEGQSRSLLRELGV